MRQNQEFYAGLAVAIQEFNLLNNWLFTLFSHIVSGDFYFTIYASAKPS